MYIGYGRDWVGMGVYVLGKSSAFVLKINMFDIGNTYGVKNKNRSTCLIYLLDYFSLEMPNTIIYT